MKRLLTMFLILALILPASVIAEDFFDVQTEINMNPPVRISLKTMHTFAGTIMETETHGDYCQIKVAVETENDGEDPAVPFWSDYAYFLARFDVTEHAYTPAVGDRIEVTGRLEPSYSSVFVPYFFITAIDGNESF